MLIQTERLLIRTFNKEDANDVFHIYNNQEVCRYLLEDSWNKNDLNAKFDLKLKNHTLTNQSSLSLAVVLNDTVIGDISVWYTEMKETVEIGFVFNPTYKRKGYAKESLKALVKELFDNYHIHRIQANLDARNIASARTCESIGMRREAHFKEDFWNKGEWTDSYVYGMLLSDIK